MNSAIHISQARRILDSGKPASIAVLKKNGQIMVADDIVSLRYDYYTGTRTIKFLRSGEKRMIRDVCIISINDFDVFL